VVPAWHWPLTVRYVGGVVLDDDDVGLAYVLVRIAVAYLQRVNGAVPPDAVALRDQLATFAARKSSGQVNSAHETAKPAGAGAMAISVQQAAAQLVLTEQRVRSLCRSGALVAVQSAAGRWQIDADSATALAARRRGT
jgi:hypothetical protein